MSSDTWISVDYLNPTDFSSYLDTLDDDEKNIELVEYSKRQAKRMLKQEMEKNDCFYTFIKNYSPRDFKIICGLSYVSQRVIIKHVKYWNEMHPEKKIKKLRIFFY
jgi:predicted nuclease of restriction endonuclease-like RecB superfamily